MSKDKSNGPRLGLIPKNVEQVNFRNLDLDLDSRAGFKPRNSENVVFRELPLGVTFHQGGVGTRNLGKLLLMGRALKRPKHTGELQPGAEVATGQK